MIEGSKARWVGSSLSAFLAVMLMMLSIAVFAAPPPNSGNYKEVYDFKFDKAQVKERAINEFKTARNPAELDFDHLLFSSVKGQNCHGKPARYIIVLANSPSRPDFPSFVTFDVSNPRKWFILTSGAGGYSLSDLIAELRSPTFTSDIICGD
jgi:hypothetical protein